MTLLFATLTAIAIAAILTLVVWKNVEENYGQGKQLTWGELGCTLLLFPIFLIIIGIILFFILD
ncbi:MAG: hypothetical protein SAJ12_00505 [Jaaginema sp. PMC 1079.18]|nr:hypothetical protein [Jaaginema sp. PMC 1080.18]MEC4849464.1 hypothetical protein [Jaaginema sp. PMC 1079.18]MEC4865437.1 hypothetical protein [Jaaginema sp. PMC 1078.18]